MTGYPCCCPPVYDTHNCNRCSGPYGSDNAPGAFKVEFEGIEEDGCGNCDDYNKSYIAPVIDATSTGAPACYWTTNVGIPDTCFHAGNPGNVSVSAGVNWMYCWYRMVSNTLPYQFVYVLSFAKGYGGKPDCKLLVEDELTLYGVSAHPGIDIWEDICDPGTVAIPKITCKITSLPVL